MKSSYTALGVIAVALAGLWYVGGGTAVPSRAVATAEQPRVSSPVAHDNLTVFFIHGPDSVSDTHKVATLQEGIEAGWAIVHETGDVNQLAVENCSTEYELFIQEGDMIRGGKQDRVIAVDMLLPPKSGLVPFPAHCVESGRWKNRGNEAATHFNKSDQFAVGNQLRYANATQQQSEVWANVQKTQENLSSKVGVKVNAEESATSLQLALENSVVQARVAEFEQALRMAGESRKNIIGVVFLVNGQITGAEVYGSNALFQKAWPKLLRSQATDAVAEKTDKRLPPTPSTQEVERFLAMAGQQATPSGSNRRVPTGNPNSPDLTNEDVGLANQELMRPLFDPIARPDAQAFTGRSGATQARTMREGGANTVNPTNPAPDSIIQAGSGVGRIDEQQLRRIVEQWSGHGPQDPRPAIEELMRGLSPRQRQQVEEYFRALERTQGQQAANPPGQESPGIQWRNFWFSSQQQAANPQPQLPAPNPAPNPAGNPQLRPQSQSQEEPAPAIGNRAALLGNQAPPVAGTNPNGNRLNVNRTEDPNSLVSEARDPARQNAVIHKSYLKLTPKAAQGGVAPTR